MKRRIIVFSVCLSVLLLSAAAPVILAQFNCGSEITCVYVYLQYRCDNQQNGQPIRPPIVPNIFIRIADLTTSEPDYADYSLVREEEGENDILYSVLVVNVTPAHDYEAIFYINDQATGDWFNVDPPVAVGHLIPLSTCGRYMLPLVEK